MFHYARNFLPKERTEERTNHMWNISHVVWRTFGWFSESVVKTGQEFIQTSGEIKEKNANKQKNTLVLNACLQADVGNFVKPLEIEVT